MIPQEVIDRILDKVSIIDVVGKYIEVKKSGRNFLALCPFHQEKTPSFNLSEEKGLYHCFGCKASGNSVRFLMEYRKLTFLESIQELASMAGIDLSQYENRGDGGAGSRKKEALLAIHRDAMQYFHEMLLSSASAAKAREYLKKRKMTLDTVKKFRLGFGGTEWRGLYAFLRNKGHQDDELALSGVVVRTSGGQEGRRAASTGSAGAAEGAGGGQTGANPGGQAAGFYDRFRERVIFPILDREGNCVGFGGRILTDDKKAAKYLNSPESPLFHKGGLLFALSYAKDAFAREKEAIIVEGYMDVLALHQAGVQNAVAPLGTALAATQLDIIARYCEGVLFIFDGDEAGRMAANRALDTAVAIELAQWVVIMPKNVKDPDEFVNKYGKEAFNAYIGKNRWSPIDFKLKYFSTKFNIQTNGAQDGRSAAGTGGAGAAKVRFLAAVFPYIARLKNAIVREDCLKKTAGFIKENLEVIMAEYNGFLKNDKKMGMALKATGRDESRIDQDELDFIGILLNNPGQIAEISPIIGPEVFQNAEIRSVFEFLRENSDKNPKELLSGIENPLILESASRFALTPDFDPFYLKEVAYKLKFDYILRMMSNNRGKQEESAANPDLLRVLLEEQQDLQNQKEQLTKLLDKMGYGE